MKQKVNSNETDEVITWKCILPYIIFNWNLNRIESHALRCNSYLNAGNWRRMLYTEQCLH